MAKDPVDIGSDEFTLVDDELRNSLHGSMDSFVTVGNQSSEDSYTIIDRHTDTGELEEQTTGQVRSDSDCNESEKEEDSEDDCHTTNNSVESTHITETMPFTVLETEVTTSNESSLISEVTSSSQPFPQKGTQKKKHILDSTFKDILPKDCHQLIGDTTSGGSMTQSVMISSEDYISQSRARSLQKHNKDLLIKNKKLSSMLSEEKEKSEEQLKQKIEENTNLLESVDNLQEEIAQLKDSLSACNEKVNSLEVTLHSKNEYITARIEEVEYLSAENAMLKRKSTNDALEIKKLQDKIAQYKSKSSSHHRNHSEPLLPSSSGHRHHHSSGHSSGTHHSHHKRNEGQRRDQIVVPPSSQTQSKRPDFTTTGHNTAGSLESLRKTSALTICPICGEERPAEKAMDMTRHIEACLQKQGYA